MEICIDNLKINYNVSGEGKDVLVMHGWGACADAVRPIAAALEKNFRVWTLDLPGFGKSDVPPENWDVYSYADFMKQFIDETGIKTPVLIGHSFGGRLAIILAGKEKIDINKIILVDSAGIKPKHGAGYYIKVYSYKLAKRLARLVGRFSLEAAENLKSKFGSADYKNANPTMRTIMVRVVNEDLTGYLKDIAVPTLLIWGDKDDATPLSDAELMEKLIPDAGLCVLSGAGHFSYLDRPGDFGVIANKFLENEVEK